jgi:hypothetical protein
MHRTVTLSLLLAACGLCGLSLVAQTPPADADQQVHADLNQLMRGALYPAANVVFASQVDDPEELKKAFTGDPSMATDPVTAAFGGWVAVENAALALAESANLLALEGRNCSNGVPVPVKDQAWAAFVQQMRSGSMQAYQAARTRDQDQMIDASNALNASCEGCHRRWRNPRTPANRCK